MLGEGSDLGEELNTDKCTKNRKSKKPVKEAGQHYDKYRSVLPQPDQSSSPGIDQYRVQVSKELFGLEWALF